MQYQKHEDRTRKGLLACDRTLAATTVLHFRTLIEQGLLQLLPST